MEYNKYTRERERMEAELAKLGVSVSWSFEIVVTM